MGIGIWLSMNILNSEKNEISQQNFSLKELREKSM